MQRPYISLGAEELGSLFEEHENDPAVLRRILAELGHRKTERAKRLRRRVEERLAALRQGRAVDCTGQTDLFEGRSRGTRSSARDSDRPTEDREARNNSRSGAQPGSRDDRGEDPRDATPPDDRHLPVRFSRISRPGVRGKPDAYVPALSTDLVLDLSKGNTRIHRFVAALDALVAEMRREGAGQRRYELKSGKAVDFQGGQGIYAFPFHEEADIFEDAQIEIDVAGRRTKGQIVSISDGTLLVALEGDIGSSVPACVLLIDNTALIVALKERLEQVAEGKLNLNVDLAESVLDPEATPIDVSPFEPPIQRLNANQAEAARHMLRTNVAFLWGPPGTGKTETLSAVVEAAFGGEKRVLIASNTNQAVDQVLLKLCKRLGTGHPALDEGRILRLGQITNNDLKEYDRYVTAEGVLERRSAELKRRQGEIETEIAGIDARLRPIQRLLGVFTEIDAAEENLQRLRTEVEEAAAEGKRAIAARTRAKEHLEGYKDELARAEQAGAIRRAFLRSEERIKADIVETQLECDRQSARASQLKAQFDAARARRDAQEAEIARLKAVVEGRDRKTLERDKATLDAQRDPLVTELQDIARKLADLEAEILRSARIVGTTVAKCYLRAKDVGRFDFVVVDEASMVLLPALYFAVGLSTERVIISGDFRQLSPIVPTKQQAIFDEIGRDVFATAEIGEDDNPRCVRLNVQYRMAEPICRLISRPMYTGRLIVAPDREPPEGPAAPSPVNGQLTIVDTSRLWPFESRNLFGSRFNLLSALLVRNLAIYLRETGFVKRTSDLGICTPYAAQAKILQGLMGDHGLADFVSAGTVHRYQGDQKRMIVLDIPDSIGGNFGIGLFTQGLPPDHAGARLINVAVSRAQEHLVIFANLTYLEDRLPSTALLRHILFEMQEEGRIVEAHDILAMRPVDQDLKRLLGITEIEFDTDKLGLFDSKAFSPACLSDMARARKSIVVFSGFVTPERVAQYGELFRAKRAEGVAVRCITRPPRFNGSMPQSATRLALDALEAAGAVVDCRRDIHEKVVLIDNQIVWSGSLNALSHTARTDEFMSRAESPLYAEQVAAFLSKRPGIAPGAAAASVAEPENPRCPKCGGRTYYADGRYGPYFRCESEDECDWNQSARQNQRRAKPSGDHPQDGPPCPECGAKTRLRQGRFGEFYGCTAYPKCKGIVKPTSSKRSRRRRKSAEASA